MRKPHNVENLLAVFINDSKPSITGNTSMVSPVYISTYCLFFKFWSILIFLHSNQSQTEAGRDNSLIPIGYSENHVHCACCIDGTRLMVVLVATNCLLKGPSILSLDIIP